MSRVPMSTKQQNVIRYFENLLALDGWLEEFLECTNATSDAPYYYHIDHIQILYESGKYVLIAVFHKVYLEKGV